MSADRLSLVTASAEQTEELGRAMAEMIERGVVALRGELASGKTCFVRGMARHVGASPAVHSPTFTLINEYGDAQRLYHFDLYRLSGPAEVEDLGCAELFDGDAVCAVEWADRAEGLLPERRIDVTFEHAGDDRRTVEIVNAGILASGWQQRLRAAAGL